MRKVTLAAVLTAVAAGIAAWGGAAWVTKAQAQDSSTFTIPAPETLMPEIPSLDLWRTSPHANITREAFRHWDHEDDKMIPEACSKCHSTAGFMDFLGADGSAAGVVDVKHTPDPASAMGISCMACHNGVARNMSMVTFPSGAEVEVFTPDARCMTCHGGRASVVQVNEAIDKAGASGDDATSADLGFVNIHYRAAAASRFGGEAQGGYEYDGQDYVGYYFHDQVSQTCNDCHNVHTLEVKVETCTDCHDGIDPANKESLFTIRTSKADFDGNGDTSEGIHAEIKTVQAKLLEAIKGYGKDVAGTAVAYDEHNYPYFFQDTDGSGMIEEGEAKFPNRYQSWTPRMLKAAYNFQLVEKDPGIFTHNPYYALQLMQDSIADLAAGGSGVEVVGMRPE